MKKIIFFFSITFFIFSCKKKETEIIPTTPTIPAKTILDVAYGTDANQKMDVYLPENRTVNTKTIVTIHGGAWFSGDKMDVNFILDSMRKRLPTYAFVNINYRLALAPFNIFPTANNDLTTALSFLISKKTEYIIADKVILFGLSAGAHMALYEAYKNNSANNIKAVISAFGIPDLADMWINPAGTPTFTRPALTNYLGVSYTANPLLYTQASPTTYANSLSVPTQLFHGTADTLVRYQQSVNLKNKLTTLGVPVQYTEYAGEGHGWFGAPLSDTYAKMTLFIKQYLP
jgi:acetyl esterase/lipase